jgi:hypothetical protein
MGLDAAHSCLEIPAAQPQQQVQAVATTAAVVLAAALVAEPAARPVIAVPAVAVGAAAGGAGLMAVLQLLRVQARQLDQQAGPLAIGGGQGLVGHPCDPAPSELAGGWSNWRRCSAFIRPTIERRMKEARLSMPSAWASIQSTTGSGSWS